MPKLPKLVNRGPAGLRDKIEQRNGESDHMGSGPAFWAEAPRDRIAPDLKLLPLFEIDQLVHDPNNARVHGERNMVSIKDSLAHFGQQKAIVVRGPLPDGKYMVMAGNGTLQAARELGWTRLAGSRTDLGEVQAISYGLADNRTAELAKWNFEVVARLDRIMQEANETPIGWSRDELEVLRMADWTPPVLDEAVGGEGDSKPTVFGFSADQMEVVNRGVGVLRSMRDEPDLDPADALTQIVSSWLTYCVTETPTPDEVE